MLLTKMRLGDLIQISDETNSLLESTDFIGININKEFMPTVANIIDIDPSKYKVLRKNRFVFSGMQTGRDISIRIGLYDKESPSIVSPAYTTFEIIKPDKILHEYLFMKFLSKEMDRKGWFLSDSSVRSNLDWPRFCDIEILLPSLTIQQKAVDAYNAIKSIFAAYEEGIADLKLTCQAYIEKLAKLYPLEEIGQYIEPSDERNSNLEITLAQGVNIDKVFTEPKRIADDLYSTSIVRTGQFAYNKVMKRQGTKLPIALRKGEDCIVSGSYQVFSVKDPERLLSEYLMLWFERAETERYLGFIAFGSTRDVIQFEDLSKVKIPIPPITIQQSIVDIYNSQIARQEIAASLKSKLRELCPVLISQSIAQA